MRYDEFIALLLLWSLVL
jgi:hypothetical protein